MKKASNFSFFKLQSWPRRKRIFLLLLILLLFVGIVCQSIWPDIPLKLICYLSILLTIPLSLIGRGHTNSNTPWIFYVPATIILAAFLSGNFLPHSFPDSLFNTNFNRNLLLIVLPTIAFSMFYYSAQHWLKYTGLDNQIAQLGIPDKEFNYRITGHSTSLSAVPASDIEEEDEKLQQRHQTILVHLKEEEYNFIFKYADIDSHKTLIIDTTSRFNLDLQLAENFKTIVNLKKINDIRFINKFFESANHKIELGGLFIDCVETKNQRKSRILNKYPFGLNYVYYTLDFIIKRVFPKFGLTKKIYFYLTRGNNRVLTKAETFGRLYSCGFEVIAERQINGLLYFVARKVTQPLYPKNPTYGPFIRLHRVGKKGKIIKVYKLRTMHPFSEFLQEYIYQTLGLQLGGKFQSDFRVTTLGKFLRMFWLDELPMLINLIKGEMKIVGVRPLSKHYFSLYSEELRNLRIHTKPGLIPPFYADCPKSLDEIQLSEKNYLERYAQHPFRTDVSYFFKAVFNILFRRCRSN